MDILIVEPYMTGSHAEWVRGYGAYSAHELELLALPGRHWKWRMHGGAVTLADRFREKGLEPDLILASDMLDLAAFTALAGPGALRAARAVYFHENQLSYPWPETDPDPGLERDAHYGFVNYTSALAADAVFFNSRYHMESFLGSLPRFLGAFPDYTGTKNIQAIEEKSRVLHLGLDLAWLDRHRVEREPGRTPLILWNHRWEYDKNPGPFFDLLFALDGEGLGFEVAVLGESFESSPAVFEEARERLGDSIVRFGYAQTREEYASWLWRADLLPVTSMHDFFGASVVEAAWCGALPLLPDALAYPEHIPDELRGTCLYDGPDDLLERTRSLLGKRHEDISRVLRRHLSRYDWSASAPLYDETFSSLVSESNK